MNRRHRAFARIRQALATHADLARKLATLERQYDPRFKVVFDALRALMREPEKKKKNHRVRRQGSQGKVWEVEWGP